MPFLLKLDKILAPDDVIFGDDPPDFVFHFNSIRIGVELTALTPTVFSQHGYSRRAEHKKWSEDIKNKPLPRHELAWGNFSLRQSLQALEQHLSAKERKAKTWKEPFTEKWLLMQTDRAVDWWQPGASMRLVRRKKSPIISPKWPLKFHSCARKRRRSISSFCFRELLSSRSKRFPAALTNYLLQEKISSTEAQKLRPSILTGKRTSHRSWSDLCLVRSLLCAGVISSRLGDDAR